MRHVLRCTLLVIALFGTAASAQRAPNPAAVDSFVTAQMARRGVPGLSLAVIQDGRVVLSKGYGVVEAGGTTPVTTSTLFQAGSISKSVAAAGALRLVEQGKLALDTDVNRTLTGWTLPASALTTTKPVTLRLLLAHSGGLTVHGFPGYAADARVPTLTQVLDGTPPANTPPIRVDIEPDSRWRYSGGGYTVMQQMMLDVTGRAFPELMRDEVLARVGMTRSSFEQPLPAVLAATTATAHTSRRRPVPGRWHLYPEMAAAGLWTTPTDLARFAIEIQRAYAGASSRLISPAMAKQMLTEHKQGDGLGVFVRGTGRTLTFEHGGRDEGFDATMQALAETGQGVVAMINSNDNSGMMGRITRFIAREYGWPTASTYFPPSAAEVRLTAEQLQPFVGRYEMSNNNMASISVTNGRLTSVSDGFPDEEFIALGGDRFVSADRDLRLAFSRGADGEVTSLARTAGGQERVVPRIGPPFARLPRQADVDPAITRTIEEALRALAKGGPETAALQTLTAGARRAFSQAGPWRQVEGLRAIAFVAEQRVAGRGLERHDFAVDRIRYYTATTGDGERSLLIWVTKDGLIADFDAVDD